MCRLEGKRAIVTGAASGIGRASAIAFARAGAAVLLSDKDDEVREVARAIEESGGKAAIAVGDVGREATCEGLVRRCVSAFGGLDVMFANAGMVNSIDPVVELSEQDWVDLLRVNVLGTFFCLKHAARHMVDHGGGAIVLTASVAGLRAGAGPAHYSASKAAVINLAQNAAWQLSGTNVRVNAICPGLIETGMTRPIFEMARAAGKEDRIGQLNPLGRAGQPEEIAEVALFLASSASGYMNGEALVVDGGLSASLPVVPGRLL